MLHVMGGVQGPTLRPRWGPRAMKALEFLAFSGQKISILTSEAQILNFGGAKNPGQKHLKTHSRPNPQPEPNSL